MSFKNHHVGSCEVIKIHGQPVLPGNMKMWDHNITFKKPPTDPKTSGSHKMDASPIKRKCLKKQTDQTHKPNQTKPKHHFSWPQRGVANWVQSLENIICNLIGDPFKKHKALCFILISRDAQIMVFLSVSITLRNSKLGIYPLDEQNMYGGSVCVH